MLFNSFHFLFFLPVVVLLYYLLANKYRWMLIFVASCYFYMAFVPKYILILFLIIIIDYTSAIAIERAKKKTKKLWLVASLLSNIFLLCFFKYFNFLNENLETVFTLFGKEFHPLNLNIILPIGLSFHTFQSMSYTIEVYRGNQKAEKHLGYFANYVLFFPQMVAGPIERYDHLGNALKEEHKPVYQNFSDGFKLVLFGLFVKMVIADNIAPLVNQVYLDPLKYSSYEVLSAIFLFSFQIYADFFGYSTIAVGCAKLLGIGIMDNFKTPYLSRSVSEFWSRWHISLSTWFRDYLYIPLGGNRVKLPRWTINILIVFMVSGLWHGASWTFVVWGALHGIMLLLERYFSMLFNFKIKKEWSVFNVLLTIKTFIITSFIWIFFRAENFSKAKNVLKALLRNTSLDSSHLSLLLPLAFVGLLLIADLFTYSSRFDKRLNNFITPYRWTVYTILLFCLFALSGTQKFAFIYFQF
ncbi:MBOAT family O-acyltransferase [Aurantibacillus circumpalustris]|uniref:MBOAT family O-acyltransferase n=1 Tax=Aurantibacillus circumpalustris TaxID=3036359 RepID=UPI00295A8D20|nr:MBOAT family O-acyltransferase [Aurantibacillus circumpalustris]